MRGRSALAGVVATLVFFTTLALGCGGGDAKPGGDAAPTTDGAVSGADAVPDEAPPFRLSGRIVVEPSALLLTKAGETGQLRARVLDLAGKPLDRVVTWESSRAEAVTVDGTGKVTTTTALGSAQITARAGDISSDPVLVLIAEPAAGALLVADAQITAGPTLVDPAKAFTPGESRSRLTLTGVDQPAAGTLVIAREGKPVGGKVVSATASGGGFDVVLEAVPLFSLFKQLDVSATFALDQRAVALAELEPPRPAPAPSPLLPRPRADRDAWPRKARPPHLNNATVRLGPLECEVTAGATLLTGDVSVRIQPDLHMSMDMREDADGRYASLRVLAQGSLTATLSGGVRIAPGFTGTASCKVTLFRLPIALGGPLALVGSLRVPVGLKLGIEGAATLSPEARPELRGTTQLSVGFAYTPQTGFMDLSSTDNDFQPRMGFTEFAADDTPFRIDGNISFGVTAKLQLTSPVGESLGLIQPLDILDAFAGAKADFELAPESAQLTDRTFAASYKLKATAELGPGMAIQDALRWLGGPIQIGAKAVFERPIGRSPFGVLTADRRTVRPGETVHLTVRLDPSALSLVGIDNVKEVHLLQAKPEMPTPTLLKNLGAGAETTFAWTPTPLERGTYYFYATVLSTLAPILPLEVREDTETQVTVGEGGGWMGMIAWTMMGTLAPAPVGGFTKMYRANGMIKVAPGTSAGSVTVTEASASYTYEETEDAQDMYVQGACTHNVSQRRATNLSGTSSAKPQSVAIVVDPSDGRWTVTVPQPPGMTTGETRTTATDLVTGNGCTSPQPTNESKPAMGIMPSGALLLMGTLPANNHNLIAGSAMVTIPGTPDLVYQVTYSLSR